jgi:hypothetical protein
MDENTGKVMAGGRKRITRKTLQGIKHGRSGYNRGCGCDTCLDEERDYQLWRKQCRAGATELPFVDWRVERDKEDVGDFMLTDDDAEDEDMATVTELRTGSPVRVRTRGTRAAAKPKVVVIGDHEQAVIDECEGLSLAVERPAMVMAARNAARIMDNPKQATLHTQASRQMVSILNDLRGNSKKKSKGRLAKVQSMTSRASNN